MDAVIAANHLSKSFGGKTVVRELDLAVPSGAVYALLGDNGAGKSTTIRMLMGLLPPDGGRATILGKDCWREAVALRERVGYVPERPRYYDWMTVAETGWFIAGFHQPGFLPRYHALTGRFGLDAKARLRNLSKGEYAKVGLAMALAHEPEVLILDEPTSGLDLFVRRQFLASMVDLAGAGRTIFISSHGVAEIERVASHAAFLAEGRILLAGTLDELRHRVVRVRLSFDAEPPDGTRFGSVLEQEVSDRQWEAVLQDPDRPALHALREGGGVADFEESPLSLEAMYTALLGRYHGNGREGNRQPSLETAETAGEGRP